MPKLLPQLEGESYQAWMDRNAADLPEADPLAQPAIINPHRTRAPLSAKDGRRSKPLDPNHEFSDANYQRHRRLKEDPCEGCRAEHARINAERKDVKDPNHNARQALKLLRRVLTLVPHERAVELLDQATQPEPAP